MNKNAAIIHIGNKASKKMCPNHKVHEKVMKESDQEKYLGDYLTNKANSKETIKKRIARGYAVLSNMTSLLNDIPLGNKRIAMGLSLRSAWFMNGCFFNSEVWSGYHKSDFEEHNLIDHKILRLILGAQAKVPIEMLYMETSVLPILDVISVRRMLYYQTILKRHDQEHTKKIFMAMKQHPLKDDWIELLVKDLTKVNLSLDDEEKIKCMTQTEFKSRIQKELRNHTFNELETIKSTHKKVKYIKHKDMLKP